MSLAAQIELRMVSRLVGLCLLVAGWTVEGYGGWGPGEHYGHTGQTRLYRRSELGRLKSGHRSREVLTDIERS